MWMWEAISVTNIGAQDDPIPALTFQLRYRVNSTFNAIEGQDHFTVIGDGRFMKY